MTEGLYRIRMKNLVRTLIGTPLFDIANKYFLESKALELYILDDEGLTEEDLSLIKAQVELDFQTGKIPETLKNALVTALEGLK